MQKYLVAFRDLGKGYFVNDCGFDNYCDAVCYAAQVLQVAGSQIAEARIWDSATKTLVLQITRGDHRLLSLPKQVAELAETGDNVMLARKP